MSLELQVLRTAKAAVDEGLMEAADYTVVKEAFMKALAIKGGVDSGFLGQADFAEARKEFFSSLGMTGMGGAAAAAPQSAPPQQPPASTPRAAGAIGASQPAAAAATNGVTPSSTPPRPAAAAAGTNRGPPALAIPDRQPSTAGATPTGPDATTPKSNPGTPGPGDISDRGGGAAAVADKRSMAGISIHPDSVNVVWELRVKKKYRWVTFQIAGSGKEVVIESAAQPSSTWAEFVAAVPDSQCRYGVFDFKYVNSEGTEFGRLVFLSWAPDSAPTKAKMQHAATKDLFRGLIEGVSVELHATDEAELSEAAVREQVANTVKIK